MEEIEGILRECGIDLLVDRPIPDIGEIVTTELSGGCSRPDDEIKDCTLSRYLKSTHLKQTIYRCIVRCWSDEQVDSVLADFVNVRIM